MTIVDDVVWPALRATRANPPAAAAADPDRRTTYTSALEQSEQFFRAARTAGPATRPVQLFYGLSQAGRAIAAAAKTAGNDWRLMLHGITCKGLDGDFARIAAVPTAKGSFVRLSEILNSPAIPDTRLPLADLWNTIPQIRSWPIGSGLTPRPALYVDHQDFDQPHSLVTFIVGDLPTWVVESTTPAVSLRELLSGYPTLAGRDFGYVRVGDSKDSDPAISRYVNGLGEVTVTVPVRSDRSSASPDERQAAFEAIGIRHGTGSRSYYLVPTVGANTAPMHPLMTWWAVLFTLSMLARYQPAEWSRHIDVDGSPYAVALEQIMATALSEVPDQVLATIRAVS